MRPQLMGVESIELDTVNLRMVARTLPGKQFEVGRRLAPAGGRGADPRRHRHAGRQPAGGRRDSRIRPPPRAPRRRRRGRSGRR